jgi:prepilin-type N-terminal cleavage/methylation domain-containing protein
MSRRHKGFTLIELLIVIAIIGILIAAIAVAVTKAKEFANNNDQKANMKNLAQACRVAETGEGKLPPAYGVYGRPVSGATAPQTNNLFIHMLPYLENKALFDNTTAYTTATVKVYLSLMDPSLTTTANRTSFVANIRVFSLTGMQSDYTQPVTMASAANASGLATERIGDGPVNTILFATKYAVCNAQANQFTSHPNSANGPYFGGGSHFGTQTPKSDIPTGTTTALPPYQIAPSLATTGTNVCNKDHGLFGHSFGGAGLAVAMADASVRNLSFSVTGTTFARALHPSDGLPLGSDW